jgi:transposase
MTDGESNATHTSQIANEPVAVAAASESHSAQDTLIRRTEVPRDVDYPLQLAWIQRQKNTERHTAYSFSMIAALTQHCVLAAQITEGGTDAVVFDNFLHRLLTKLRTDKATKTKHVVVLMDNATIHKHSSIYETARKFKVNVLLNAQYSPWLNPVEQLFNHIKRALRKANWRPDKEQVCSELQRIIKELNMSKQVERLWLYSLKAWSETIRLGHFDLS